MWHKFSGTSAMQVGNDKFFFYSVDKEQELFKMNLDGIESFFSMLDKLGKKAIGHVVVLFDGYNDITDELFEIHEVRNYVQEMFKRFPHLLNYINFDLEGHHWLLSCLVDVDSIYAGRKMTFEEHIKQFGTHVPMPRFLVHMHMPDPMLNKLINAMRIHANKLKAGKQVEGQVMRLRAIFK